MNSDLMTAPKLLDRSLFKFLIVGIGNTLTGLSVIYAMKYFFAANDIYANAFGYTCGLIVSYALNSRWTFEFKGEQLSAFKRFCICFLLSYAANILTVMTLIKALSLDAYLAQALGMPAYTVTNYILCKHYAFKKDSLSTPQPEAVSPTKPD
ncbi:GtrA family protein [Pseudomonas fitomaticsae]|uniref:GtrA family protein n=1 Tax=Pseudomonas fitomaticsae TaxID=2837969 RepID=A0ABY3Q985_9PSED|nr:GtrA family protein [Pseudomonas fitomaticsae]UFQ02725.1 GtrA family protein [Pseudomonas fitomaticsae]